MTSSFVTLLLKPAPPCVVFWGVCKPLLYLSLSLSLSIHKMLRGNGEDKKKLSKKKAGSGHLLDAAVGCSDMVLLDPLTVDNMVKNLQERYKAGDIYVS